jgi:hypothetical protein
MGIVSARSGWSGDESLVVFKCGPPIGHFATDKLSYNLGIGHNHPDANHFTIFGCGEWLLRDDGYAWKDTGQHNTLLVDGKGQVGDGLAWFNAARLDISTLKIHPRVIAAISSASLDQFSGDATAAYPPASGLKRFIRRLYFLKPDVLIVVDDLEADAPRRLELRFHPEYACEKVKDGSFLARAPTASLRIELFTTDGVEVISGEVDGRDRDGKPMPMHTVRMLTTRSTWKNVVAFSWSPNGAEPIRLTRERAGKEWILHASERSVKLTL